MFSQISLVQHLQSLSRGARKHCITGAWLAGIRDFQEQIGSLDLPDSSLDAFRFDFVRCFSHSGGIDQAEGDAMKIDHLLDGVASGASGLAHDGPFKT